MAVSMIENNEAGGQRVSVWICEVKYDCQLPIVEWLGPWIPGIGGWLQSWTSARLIANLT